MGKGTVIACLFAVVVVIVLVVTLIATSLEIIEFGEVGLQYNTVSKSLDSTPLREGLHAGPPGFIFIKYPTVYTSEFFDDLRCINKDGVETFLDISFQYKVQTDKVYNITLDFGNYINFVQVLRYIAASTILDACAVFNTSRFQAERGAFQQEVRKQVVAEYHKMFTDITDLQVRDIWRPKEVEDVVKRKEAAREDIQVALQERPQKVTMANTEKLQAETEATILLDKAHSRAKIILDRAYAQADAISDSFQKQTQSFKNVASRLNLTTKGIVAYLAVRTVEETKNNFRVAIKSPAQPIVFP